MEAAYPPGRVDVGTATRGRARTPRWRTYNAESIHQSGRFPEKGGKVAFKVRSAGVSIQTTETVLEYQPAKLHERQSLEQGLQNFKALVERP
jgi:hypothetical protein